METIEEHSSAKSDEMSVSPTPENIRLCLVGSVVDDESVVTAARSFGLPVLTSETGLEILSDDEWMTHFVIKEFDGPIFEAIHKSKHRILGPPALLYAAKMKQGLFNNTRPVYNYSMKGVITCFTGIRKKDELTKLVKLIHSMGGGIRKDMNSKVTHLISNVSGGEKYQYAKTFRLTVLRSQWVHDAWEKRDEPQFLATAEEFAKHHKLKVFEGQKICFFGFPPEEHEHMLDVLRINGGTAVELDDPDCTHVVVDEHFTQAKPEPKNSRTHILKSDWFWYTIQNGYADEMDYSFRDYLDSIANTPSSDRRESLPISFNKRKRKRFSQRIQLEGTPLGSGKRRSSVSDAGLLSVSGSFFDSTASPDKLENTTKILAEPEPIVESTPKKKSARFNHFMDFFITESNFVGILDTIVHLFKNPLEERAETSDALLNKSEIKAIFGNLTPIYDIHQRMLEKLSEIHTKWREDALIGEIILQHRDELTKTYPPFVNFFEQMQECLTQCDAHNPRFHAFLKINQAKPECGRENLQDLMIRPVQRLPHISLLLKGILKNTNKNNPDHQKLEEALKAIKEVMTHINENKRKTEEQMVIFDIFNEIDGCPADLISSSRSFISKCEVTELSDNLSGRGDTLSLYLFSDTIVVCKKRSRAFNTAKSPGTAKSSKHIKLISLNAIRFVIDITDSPRAFAMICRQDKDKLYSFSVADDVDKAVYLKTLCKQMAQNACRTDTDKALLYRTSQELEIDISDVNLSTLSKAFKLAARTRLKVGRAFSFSKTPSKLKRAVSTMMTSPFGSTNTLTPASQLAQMRLASCTNINEVAGEVSSRSESPTSQSEVLVAPMSLQPSRKAKSSTLAALRRL